MLRKRIQTPEKLAKQKEVYDKFREDRRRWNREWIANNRARYNWAKHEYRRKLKREVMELYCKGPVKCSLCNYDNIDALVLDHIDDNGAAHRKELGISSRGNSGGVRIYERIGALGKTIEGLQVLCANCNTAKEIQRKLRMKTARWGPNPFTDNPEATPETTCSETPRNQP